MVQIWKNYLMKKCTFISEFGSFGVRIRGDFSLNQTRWEQG